MLAKSKECSGCPLESYKGGFSNPEGLGDSGVLIVGEALGEQEMIDALPLRPHAESGSALQTCFNNLKKFGVSLERNNFALWNLCACKPPMNKLEGMPYEEGAISHCRTAYFDKVIDYYKPKVILALGNLPMKWLIPEIKERQDSIKAKLKETKDKEEKKRLASQLSKLKISALRGYKFESIYKIPVVPTFHPSFLARGERVLLGVLLRDLMFAIEIANGEIGEYKYENYIETPDISQIDSFLTYCRQNPNLVVSYDIETPYTILEVDESETEFGNREVRDIDSIQFSVENSRSRNGSGEIKTKSIFLNWNSQLEWAKSFLELENPKVGWNNLGFDETNIEYHLGKGSIKGTRYDSMLLWKHFNSDFKKIGKALQFAANFQIPELPAWKHLSDEQPEKYGLIDVDVTLKVFLSLKEQLSKSKLEVPNAKSLFQGYEDDIVNLIPILQDMTKRGFPINIKKREEFKKELQIKRIEVLEELEEIFPTELRRPDPVLGYKNIPKEVIELAEEFEQRFCNPISKNFKIFLDANAKALILSKFIESKTRRATATKEGQTGLVVRTFIIDGQKVKRYCRLDRFKPNSSQQILNYIKFKKYKTKKKRDKKKEKETTDKAALFGLYEETQDDLFLKVGLYREIFKIIRTYIDGWPADSLGRVHSTFNAAATATGQLSCSPNIQNLVSHGTRYNSKDFLQMAQTLRSCIEPKAGHTLLSFDYTGFHAIMLGVEAEDDTYIRLAKLGIHDFLTAYMLRDEYSKKVHTDWKQIKAGKVKQDDLRNETLIRIKDLDSWLSLDDKSLADNLTWIKTNHKYMRDSQAKPAMHGLGFRMGVNKFFALNRHAFDSIEQPKRIIAIIKKLFPKVINWQDFIIDLAAEQTFLISRYGYIRRFWDVYDWRLLKEYHAPKSEYEKIFKGKNGKYWSRTEGTQIKEAVAFLPANHAFGKKKEAMRELEEVGLLEKYRLILDNHDELLFEIRDNLIDEAIIEVKKIMELPTKHISTRLFPDGVSCPVGIKLGKNWGSMKEIKL